MRRVYLCVSANSIHGFRLLLSLHASLSHLLAQRSHLSNLSALSIVLGLLRFQSFVQMANASGFFTAPSVPSLRRKVQPSLAIFGSGFRSPEGFSRRVVFCSSVEKQAGASSSTESRAPRSVHYFTSLFSLAPSCLMVWVVVCSCVLL